MKHAKTFCVIPARIGSKRIPRKNIKPLSGKPLIAYTIESAKAACVFDAVYVATDSEEIGDVSRCFGADVPFIIPPELCRDDAPSHSACLFLLDKLGTAAESDRLVCLQPTSPLRSSEDVAGAMKTFDAGQYDFLMSVTEIDPHYFHWALMPDAAGKMSMVFKDKYLKDRKYLPKAYRPNGSIKMASIGCLKSAGHFLGDVLGTYETPEERSVHIGTQTDFDFCEYLMKRAK